MPGILQEKLVKHAGLILDGAMGTELQRRGVDTGLPLWSANALIAHPEVVLQIHKDYIAAGADIITTNTFRTTGRSFRRANLPDRSKQLTATAMRLALEARDAQSAKHVLIAGSIAPLEDCYRPDLVPSDRELEEEHGTQAARLAELGADFLLLETMNTVREAHAACKAAIATGKEVVVSFICKRTGKLYSGESLEEAVSSVSGLRPTAFSLNCISPRFLGPLLIHMQELTTLPLMVYGNVGVPEDERQDERFTVDINEHDYALFADSWRSHGATIIGGCCGTTPDYVRALGRMTTKAQRHEDGRI